MVVALTKRVNCSSPPLLFTSLEIVSTAQRAWLGGIKLVLKYHTTQLSSVVVNECQVHALLQPRLPSLFCGVGPLWHMRKGPGVQLHTRSPAPLHAQQYALPPCSP